MPHHRRIVAVLITLLFATPLVARAELPLPTYPQCGEPDQPELCPPDLGYEWEWCSYIPAAWKDNIREEEWDLGPGLWADRAWRTTTGRPDVVIAILDSGVMWDFDNILRKHYLHAPELPVPQDATGADAANHDANGDGVFNITDYAEDPRLDPADGVDHADAILDPSDLIATFSDGNDDDGNGFIDDISGWDFFWNDNDPYDDTRFDHGSWEAELAVAEGNDGDNDIGVCPNCMLLNVRVGDSFVCDVSNFANGLFYAVDMDVDVVIEALGSLNNSTHAIAAIEYAWDHDVTILGSAADECAYHQNYPGNNHHTLYTHAIIHDDEDEDESTTYLNFANNTNYGGRLDLSVGAWGASSAAVGLGGGAAGLIYSRAKDIGLDPPLSAAEVRGLMLMTAVDVDVPESYTDPEKYPCKEGWDPHFGYGRLNVSHAVDRVAPETIPPEADLLTPDWFEVLDPSKTPTVDVVGYADARRAGGYTYSLQIAAGIHPDDADFTEVATGSGGAATDGVLGTVDLTAVPLDPQAAFEPYDLEDDDWTKYMKVNRWTATIRLVVEDDLGNTAVERKVIYLHQDPDLLPGFPFRTVASVESSPVAFDVDGDHRDEVLYITADGEAFLCDLTSDGLVPRAGWPQNLALQDEADPDHPANHLDQPAWTSGGVSADAHHSIMGTPAIADLDGDGVLEIVVASLGGQVIVWHTDGTVADGWPVMLPMDTIPYTEDDFELDYGSFAAPVIEDLDGDGEYEIIVAAMDQHLHVYRADGSIQPGFPVLLRHVNQLGDSEGQRIITTPAVGDMNGDGQLDIIAGTNEEPGQSTRYSVAYAVHGDGDLHAGGAVHDGWPIYAQGAFNGDLLPYVGEGAPACPAVADIDGDGTLELSFFSIGDRGYIYSGALGEASIPLDNLTNDFGSGSNSTEEAFSAVTINSPSFGDMNNDGVLDLTMGSAGWAYAEGMLDVGHRVDRDHLLAAWDGSTGEFLPGFPQVMEDMQFFMNPAIADLDGDGYAEIINGSGGFMVHAFNQDGEEPEGWPKFTGQWLLGSPSIGDINGDGMLDLIQGTRNGWLFAWTTTTPISEANVQWATMHHDLRNTRNYHTPLPTYPAVESPPDDDDGCECAQADGARPGPALAIIALLSATLVLRKR